MFAPVTPVLTARTANAQGVPGIGPTVPVFDPVANKILVGIAKINSGNLVTNQKSFWKRIAEFAAKVAGQTLKKVVLDRLVDALVAYISGQSNVIIEDWGEFFEQAGKDAAGAVAEQVGGGFLCRNFDINVRLTLLPVEKFSQRARCTLDDIVQNIDSFIENFENGGWIAYQEQWYPQNNFYGATLLALDEQARQVAKEAEAARSQGLAGGGFLSQIRCDPPGSNKNCKVVTPGSYLGSQVNNWIGGPNRQIWTILNSDDIAAYIAAIADAGINRLTKMGVDGLRGQLGNQTSGSFETATPQNPCGGLTGDAFLACIGFNQANTNLFENDRLTTQDSFSPALTARQEANSILTQLVSGQTELVDALAELQACRPEDTGVLNELGEAQATLDDLQNKLEDNLSFLNPLQENYDAINNLESGDWSGLTNTTLVNRELSDPTTAEEFLASVTEDQTAVNENVAARLPVIEGELQTCQSAFPSS